MAGDGLEESDLRNAAFTLAIGLGAAIWLASPVVTGRREPWDAHSPYYVLALIGAGLVMGWLQPQGFKRWPVGIYLGQCAAVLGLVLLRQTGLGLFIPLGMLVLAAYTGLSFAGSAAGAWLRRSVGQQ